MTNVITQQVLESQSAPPPPPSHPNNCSTTNALPCNEHQGRNIYKQLHCYVRMLKIFLSLSLSRHILYAVIYYCTTTVKVGNIMTQYD
jgi:hypothetical protein